MHADRHTAIRGEFLASIEPDRYAAPHMSALLSRIMLAIFMLPLAALIYCAAVVVGDESSFIRSTYQVYGMRRQAVLFIFAGGVGALFVGIYWWLLWRKSVAWTGSRILRTLAAAVAAMVGGVFVGYAIDWLGVNNAFPHFLGTSLAPIFWLILTAFIWRDTPEERRAKVSGKSALVCPTCGYNLTGLSATRCPECGTQFTLDELLAAQPQKATAELET